MIIDAGHGGHDFGGRGNGLTEKRLTLDTAFALRKELRARGFNAVLTRTDDRFVDLDDRVAFANRYRNGRAILVSVHYDSSGPSARGVTTFFWRTDSHGLATRVHRAVIAATGLPSVGVIRRRIRLTRNPEIPCILVECGFMSNHSDAALISEPGFRRTIAAGIAKGIANQLRLGDGDIPSVPELNEPLSRATDPRTY
ncbi:MAG TPA: N-acetylmuramoyl-L-alanine amidase [Chthoniobacterales bacterium]